MDVQVLWVTALRAAAELRALVGRPDAAPLHEEADRMVGRVNALYRWPEENYLFDSLRPEGPVRKLRPNALRAVSAGIVEPAWARSMVERVAQADLSTGWGVRTLSSRDPGYAPHTYHEGQVWTIATAWAAEAALAVRDQTRGLQFLNTIARRLTTEGGYANECYRGDRAEPYNSCFLLGFSVAPFLTVLFERLWGISVDATVGTLQLSPAFPTSWRSASLRNLRLGAGAIDIEWSPGTARVAWNGPGSLAVVTEGGSAEVTAARPASLPLALQRREEAPGEG